LQGGFLTLWNSYIVCWWWIRPTLRS